jgi:hypothetical protein
MIEVSNGTARFGWAVWTKSIWRAVCTVKAYYPSACAWVVHPIVPRNFLSGILPAWQGWLNSRCRRAQRGKPEATLQNAENRASTPRGR